MSGYVPIWKNLRTKPKFKRLIKRVKAFWDETDGPPLSIEEAESRALGYLAKLWLIADSHIREDDTLDMSPAEVDELLGTQGLCEVLGPDWLEVLDPPNQIHLPGYLSHNGSKARSTSQAASRQQKHRDKQRVTSVTQVRDAINGERDGGETVDNSANAEASPPFPSLPSPSLPNPPKSGASGPSDLKIAKDETVRGLRNRMQIPK